MHNKQLNMVGHFKLTRWFTSVISTLSHSLSALSQYSLGDDVQLCDTVCSTCKAFYKGGEMMGPGVFCSSVCTIRRADCSRLD